MDDQCLSIAGATAAAVSAPLIAACRVMWLQLQKSHQMRLDGIEAALQREIVRTEKLEGGRHVE